MTIDSFCALSALKDLTYIQRKSAKLSEGIFDNNY